MGSVTLTLRKISLKHNINDHQFQNMQLSRTRQRLTSLSSHIASGVNLNPTTLAGVGLDLFGDALDIMGNASEQAAATAELMVGAYSNAFNELGQENYYKSGLSSEAALYTDKDGVLDTSMAREKFYEQALKEYIEQYIMPILNEKEKELEEEQTHLETLIKEEEAELQAVDQAIDQAIQSEAIKLG